VNLETEKQKNTDDFAKSKTKRPARIAV